MSAGRSPATRRFFRMLGTYREDLDRRELEARVRFLGLQGVSAELAEIGITDPAFIPRAAVHVADLEALQLEANALVTERQELDAATERAEQFFKERNAA